MPTPIQNQPNYIVCHKGINKKNQKAQLIAVNAIKVQYRGDTV
jgi:hypothetical protein